MLAQAGFALTNLNYALLVGRGRTSLGTALAAGTLLVNVLANLVLIPRYGPSGAALAMTASEALLLLAQAILIWRLLRRPEASLTRPEAADERRTARPARRLMLASESSDR